MFTKRPIYIFNSCFFSISNLVETQRNRHRYTQIRNYPPIFPYHNITNEIRIPNTRIFYSLLHAFRGPLINRYFGNRFRPIVILFQQ